MGPVISSYLNILISRRSLTFILSFWCISQVIAQSYTYYQDVQPIFQKKCFTCHSKTKNSFLFNEYSLVKPRSSMIKHVIENNIMPPWPADNSYQTYANDRSLTTNEKSIIIDWFIQGMTEGVKNNSQKTINIKQKPSSLVKFKIPPIPLPPNERDTFINFSIPFSFKKEYRINRIEFSSKVLNYIHHINLFVLGKSGMMEDASFVFGYVPGIDQKEFSNGQGFYLPAEGILKGDIHIPPISQSLILDLGILFQRTDSVLQHPLFFLGAKGFMLENMTQLVIPRDSVIIIKGKMNVEQNVYLTHVLPHMHLLGKSIKVWSKDPEGNIIPFIRINSWQFNWQNFYEFEMPLFISSGSTIYVEAVYDNTIENIHNPNSPPKDVTEGWLTSQEMLSVYMLAYMPTE